MARKLKDIVAQLRAEIANPAVTATMIQTEDLAKLCDAATKPKKFRKPSPEAIDRAAAAYLAEVERWSVRRKASKGGYELVRNSSPKNNIIDESFQTVVNLTKSSCRDGHEAGGWLRTYQSRAGIIAALEAL